MTQMLSKPLRHLAVWLVWHSTGVSLIEAEKRA
jgi:hypothetical protein